MAGPRTRRRQRPPDPVLLLLIVLIALGFLAAALTAATGLAALAGSETALPPRVGFSRGPADPANRTVATFAFESARRQAAFECALDGEAFRECTSPHELSALAAGVRTLRVRARDVATGRGPPASYRWTIDLEPPTLRIPSDTVVEATGSAGAPVQFARPSATDASGLAGDPACSHVPGAMMPLGTTAVTCQAFDRAGNAATGTFLVIVRDTRPPQLGALPADMTLEAPDAGGPAVTWLMPTAVDAVSGALSVRCTPPPGSRFGIRTTAVVCAAADAAGNRAEGRFHVTVQDTRAPTLDVPADLSVQARGRRAAPVEFLVSASDEVGVVAGPRCDQRSGALFPLGKTLVSCRASDAAGNTGQASFTVTVFDATPPVIAPVIRGREGNAGWYVSRVELRWTISDPESEITSSGGCDSRRLGPESSGRTITCRASSAGGATTESVVLSIDVSPPGPTRGTWDAQESRYRLRSTDSGSGVAIIYYRFVPSGSDAPVNSTDRGWIVYSEPFAASCSADLYAFSEDRAGNREPSVMIARTGACIL